MGLNIPTKNNGHTFHIPVMGTGFTIDSPIKVAPYGISSVISLVDDRLIEDMREYYCKLLNQTYKRICDDEDDARARRITAYLDLVSEAVQNLTRTIKEMPFLPGNEISRYFEYLPDESEAKKVYLTMLETQDPVKRQGYESWLRTQVVSGAIDVNIMTKADCEHPENGQPVSREYWDAMAALRGFAKSGLDSSIVFSAGLNLHLYSYAANFEDFFAGPDGKPKKKVTLKVSDFRSAFVQAKIFAKKGIWVSEYRIESGLNCGGHAFPTDGSLFGPILEEFKMKKQELSDSLFEIYRQALLEIKGIEAIHPPAIRITAQGGVGTCAEHRFLLRYFEVDSVGWGTPFLLVPEATNVDADTLAKLTAATAEDVVLSNASPLGVPFYILRNSESENQRRAKISLGRPGSGCANKYLQMNHEYGYPLCTASYEFQRKKLDELARKKLSDQERAACYDSIVEKSCICRELGDGVRIKNDIKDKLKKLSPAVCPGPNIAFFSKTFSLREMIDHIYGRYNALDPAMKRPHVFINELKLYVDYLKNRIHKSGGKISAKESGYFFQFKENLSRSISYYKRLAEQLTEESAASRREFLENLTKVARDLAEIRDFSLESADHATT